MRIMLKLSTFIVFFSTVNCFAVQSPSNELQDQKRVGLEYKDEQSLASELRSVTQIPEATYRHLEDVFSSFYKKLTFNTSITDSTFEDNLNSELIAVPLIATNEQGLQMELFGNFTDPSRQYLSNISADNALHDYIAHSELSDIYESDLSLGAGISINTGQSSKIKFIISNHEMPGYGNSTALLGIETRF